MIRGGATILMKPLASNSSRKGRKSFISPPFFLIWVNTVVAVIPGSHLAWSHFSTFIALLTVGLRPGIEKAVSA